MGNANTEQVKRRDRRKRVRELLPHLDHVEVERLVSIDDPLARFDAIVQAAHDTGATRATIDRCEHARFVYLSSTCGGAGAAARALYDRQPEQPDDRRHRPAYVDPVLRGQARATGQTAAAVRRRTTVTDWQHAEREARP